MSSSSATVGVDKATSDLLIGPDWTMNIDICDSINNHRWQAKDVIKALKKRLQHKNPKVQLLALTLLETMVKNCGDIVHFQIADRNILQEMIKIVRKKMDMHVRDKILVLLDSWQEAFGGAGGKYPQYYWAYEELRRSGVQFPERSRDAAPIHTPPAAPSAPRHSQAGYGMPSDTSQRLDEAMASETENLSMANLYSMRSVQELLSDMLQAVNPTDREAIKDEVIVDLVSQCRSHQKKLMQMLTSTGDEQLLGQGLELNDSLQSVLAKHDAIASGSPLPAEMINNSPSGSPLPAEVTYNNSASPVPTEVRDASPRSNPAATSIASATSSQLEEEEDEDDDFAQLARRRTKASAMSSEISVQSDGAVPPPSTSSPSNALVLTTPPPAVRTSATKEQDIIDLLSITLSTTSVSPHAPQSNTNQTMNQVPYSTTSERSPYGSQVYAENQGKATYSNYVAPWAQPQPQFQQWVAPQPQPWAGQQSQPRPQQWVAQQSQPQAQQWTAQQAQPQSQQTQPWVQHQAQPPQARAQPQQWAEQQAPQHPQQQPQAQAQHQAQPQQPQPQSWAQHQAQPQQQQPQAQAQHQPQPQQPQSQPQQWAQPESQPQPQPWVQQQAQPQAWAQPQSQQWGQQQAQGQAQAWAQRQQQSQPQLQAPRQSFNYPPPPWATATTTTTQVAKLQSHNSFPARGSNGSAISEGHKPFIPSYRLFEDLNVLGSSDGGSTNSPRISGQSMLGGRK
ncbi:TOM1-like protein 6 [Papaver somniferum]|nr:TOM1-like protein 6 [Papaver somniferum]